MKTLIISYSYTGNNKVLAEETANILNADLFILEENKQRTIKKIVLDMILHRYPGIKKCPDKIYEYDLVIFFSPVWMFGISSPVRTCMKEIRRQIKRYAFVSLSGGALGPNTGISRELVRRLGKNQAFLLDFNISNFLADLEAQDVKTTSSVLLNKKSNELDSLTSIISQTVKSLN